MNEHQMEKLAIKVAREAVRETLIALNMDPTDRVAIVQDTLYTRKRRLAHEKLTSIPATVALTVMITAFVTGVWTWLTTIWNKILH
jgi:hypothetical protein